MRATMDSRRTVRSTLRKLAVVVGVAGAVVIGLVAPPAGGNERQDIDGQIPFYARLGSISTPEEVYEDGGWVAIAFYRPPSCVPDGFNLLAFFDFNAFACGPPTTDGFEIRRNGQPLTVAPLQAKYEGRGAVPVWFVSTADFAAARADGVVTIVELEAMESLLIGSATFFTQTLHPHGAATQPMNVWVARGELEDGRSFHVQAQAIDELRLETHITFR